MKKAIIHNRKRQEVLELENFISRSRQINKRKKLHQQKYSRSAESVLECPYQTAFCLRKFIEMHKQSFRLQFMVFPTLFCLGGLFSVFVQGQKPVDGIQELYRKFRAARELPCGQRADALRYGKALIEQAANATINRDIIDWVKKEMLLIAEADEKCRGNDFLISLFKNYEEARKLSCGNRSEAIRVGKIIIENFGEKSLVAESVGKVIARIEKEEIECKKLEANNPLQMLYDKFRTALRTTRNAPCGQREDLIKIGREIIKRFGTDELNQEVINFVKKQTSVIEKEDENCRRDRQFLEAYSKRDWDKLFAAGKGIIAAKETSDKNIALRVMIMLAQTGFDRAKIEKDGRFVADSLYLARKAVEIIEANPNLDIPRDFGPFDLNTSNSTARKTVLDRLKLIIEYLSDFKE